MPPRTACLSFLFCFFLLPVGFAQATASVPAKSATPQSPAAATAAAAKPADYSGESFVIEKYATDVTYADDGTGERLLTLKAKVQSDAAVRQFGVLEFPYESRNEHIEFVYVRVRKPDGSVVATPESDAQDQPAEVTRQAPFYSDIRNKQLPVKSLSVGDELEYQVRQVRTVAAAPGHFWYTQQFLTNAVVLEETASLSVPKQKYVQVESPTVKPEVTESGDRRVYRWKTSQLEKSKPVEDKPQKPVTVEEPPSIAVTTFKDWAEVGRWYGDLQKERVAVTPGVQAKADELAKGLPAAPAGDMERISAIYSYVATQYRYIGVAFGIGRYQPHSADDVMQNQYGDCKDKHTLLAALLKAAGYDAWPVLVGSQHVLQPKVPSPGQFDHVITAVTLDKSVLWMDSTAEVAPFRMLFSGLRDKQVLGIPNGSTPVLMKTPANPPFASFTQVDAKASLNAEGTLTGHLEYTMRGDDEMLFRIGFHNTPRVQWQTLVQNISYATGFAGTVSNVNAGVPEKTAEPFRYSFDYTRKEFSDWANRRILPLMPPVTFAYGEDDAKPAETILLGGPVTYRFHTQIELPESYTALPPSPVKMEMDFGSYSGKYVLDKKTLTIDRSLEWKQREIPVNRWDDYIKLEKAVAADEGTFIQLIGSGANLTASQDVSNPDAAALVRQAFADIQGRSYDAARQELDKAKQMSPTQEGLWADYGILALAQGRRDEGIDAYKKEIANHPENFAVYRSLAWTLASFDRIDEAVATLRALIKADPDSSHGRQQLASFLISKKRFAEAVPVLEEAIAKSPDTPRLKVMLGTAEISSGATEKGAAAMRDVLASSNDESILNDASYELADAKVELPLARSSCEKALRLLDELTSKTSLASLSDDDLRHVQHLGATWDTMAWILFRQGELAGAEDYSRAAWLLNPEPTTGAHLGEIYEALGKTQAAVDIYQMAIASATQWRPADEAEAKLKKLAPQKADFNHVGPVSEKLSHLRTVAIPAATKRSGSADFFILFSAKQVEEVQFLHGDESLKAFEPALRAAKYDVPFPAGSGAKVVRRGILYCSEVLKDCQFTLLLPENTKRN
jgi:tetratricopeptide (TPR) repeat protein/transglutaminase-like putative cysteine protease